MNKIIGILIIVGAVALAYFGIDTLSNSTASAEILGVELSASDQGGQMRGIIFLVLAVVAFIGGIFLTSKSKK